jgi:hypothetical protein
MTRRAHPLATTDAPSFHRNRCAIDQRSPSADGQRRDLRNHAVLPRAYIERSIDRGSSLL